MKPPSPFDPQPKPTKGDEHIETVYSAIGQMLTFWELTEQGFAYLFNSVVVPEKVSKPAQRAYGTLQAARTRKEMTEASAAVFFHQFPSEALQKRLSDILTQYSKAGSRRGEIAHGIVGGHTWDQRPKFSGYYCGPSFWNTNKRGIQLEPKFIYNSSQINELARGFSQLNIEVNHLASEISAHFHALRGTPRGLR